MWISAASLARSTCNTHYFSNSKNNQTEPKNTFFVNGPRSSTDVSLRRQRSFLVMHIIGHHLLDPPIRALKYRHYFSVVRPIIKSIGIYWRYFSMTRHYRQIPTKAVPPNPSRSIILQQICLLLLHFLPQKRFSTSQWVSLSYMYVCTHVNGCNVQ